MAKSYYKEYARRILVKSKIHQEQAAAYNAALANRLTKAADQHGDAEVLYRNRLMGFVEGVLHLRSAKTLARELAENVTTPDDVWAYNNLRRLIPTYLSWYMQDKQLDVAMDAHSGNFPNLRTNEG